jgi:hypothetical protein
MGALVEVSAVRQNIMWTRESIIEMIKQHVVNPLLSATSLGASLRIRLANGHKPPLLKSFRLPDRQ